MRELMPAMEERWAAKSERVAYACLLVRESSSGTTLRERSESAEDALQDVVRHPVRGLDGVPLVEKRVGR